MYYNFRCTNKECKCEEEKEIAMKDYDAEKDKQICSRCGSKMERIHEWNGIAIGSGEGWFGRKGGNVI